MTKKILIIEDEGDIRAVYSELLKGEGFDVIESEDGENGMAKALSEEWDLMLLDIMLPRMDGVAVLTQLAAKDEIKDRPVLLLTNLEKEDILQKCLKLGASGYLIKSDITPQQVIAEVKKYLKNQETDDEESSN